MFSLISDSLISSQSGAHNLPGLFAALARGDISAFPAERPYQRPAWHMFLVQLGALALWRGGADTLPETEDAWRPLLLGLTGGEEGPWQLIGPDDTPAFLQPARIGGLKWSRVETPDGIDTLITARNHDVKQDLALHNTAEDWVFALVSEQTMEGYGGAGNQGIARMNGGSSSRPMLGLAPAMAREGSPDPSSWWRRDTARLLEMRRTGTERPFGTPGGPCLLWTLPWPEKKQLSLPELDPWFIEICRRFRLRQENGRIVAERATSAEARIDAKEAHGVTGDPWAPVSLDARPKSLTLSDGNFDYRKISELMFSGKWQVPELARATPGEHDMLLIAEAFSRGNSKTEGFKSRIIPVPARAGRLMLSPDAGTLSQEQIDQIKVFDTALRDGLATASSGGSDEKPGEDDYARTRPARAAFSRRADALFFPALWERLAAPAPERPQLAQEFVRALYDEARRIFGASLPGIPCQTILRPRAEARARRRFHNTVWRGLGGGQDFSFLFPRTESPDDNA